MTLLIILNALNIADAILTYVAIRREGAAEANPLIDVIGLPGKIALVALATWLLARLRPRALIWPALGLAAVLAWHVAGYLVSSQLGVGLI
jgi:hypothetical protein